MMHTRQCLPQTCGRAQLRVYRLKYRITPACSNLIDVKSPTSTKLLADFNTKWAASWPQLMMCAPSYAPGHRQNARDMTQAIWMCWLAKSRL